MTTPAPRRPIDPVAAYHEAAHCILFLHKGGSIRRVSLSPDDPGKAGCCELSSSWEEDMQTDPIGFLVYLFAGAAAEKRVTGHPSPRDAQDRETASAIASIIVHDGADPQDPRVQATLRTCAALADALMWDPHVWCEVECIAAALCRRRSLTGEDLHRVLRVPAEARRSATTGAACFGTTRRGTSCSASSTTKFARRCSPLWRRSLMIQISPIAIV